MLIHTKFLLSPNLPNLAFAGVPTIHVKKQSSVGMLHFVIPGNDLKRAEK